MKKIRKSRLCQHCNDRFETTAERRVFCSDKCKTGYYREHKLTCFYCGEVGTSKDHLYPQVWGEGAGDTVPACAECNSMLSCHFATSVEERFINLYRGYVKKYQVFSRIPEWEDEELEGLGRSLRDRVESSLQKRDRIQRRLLYLKFKFRDINRGAV